MQDMKLADWLTTYKPNIINLGCLPGGEENYVKAQDVIKSTLPGTPIRNIRVSREEGIGGMIKIPFGSENITRQELFLSDLTLISNENGDLIPLRKTNQSPTVGRFVV